MYGDAFDALTRREGWQMQKETASWTNLIYLFLENVESYESLIVLLPTL